MPGAYWTDDEINHAINVAQRLWGLLTLCIERTVPVPLTIGQTFYQMLDIYADFIVPLRASFNGVRLKADTIHNLDLRSTSWRVTPGNPTRYAQHGFGLLAITPQPASGTPVLTMTFAAQPLEMFFDDDVPEIMPEQQIHLEDFAFWFCRLKEGGQELQNAVPKLNSFLEAAAKYASYQRARSRAQLYDNVPFDLASFDRGRFEIKLKNQPPMQTKLPAKGGNNAA